MMKAAMSLGLAWAAILPALAEGTPGRLERLYISGLEYVRLEDWARNRGFQVKWTVPKQEVQLSGRNATLAFSADSRKATVNGVNVWLSNPMTVRNNSACVPPVDLTTVLQPLLAPAGANAKKISSICLDPGHGGKDPGNKEGR